MSRRYRVQTMPGSSDTVGETHLAVIGPRCNEFAFQERIARLFEAALNAALEFGERDDVPTPYNPNTSTQ
jgi:hypothetical protein